MVVQSELSTFVVSSGGADSRHQLFGLHSQLEGGVRKWRRGVGAVGGWRRPAAANMESTHRRTVTARLHPLLPEPPPPPPSLSVLPAFASQQAGCRQHFVDVLGTDKTKQAPRSQRW